MNLIVDILRALWLSMPAYIANMAASLSGGRIPIDLGREFRGKRLLGNGKTIEGFSTAVMSGFLAGLIMERIPHAFWLPGMTWAAGIAAGLGAMSGDMLGSLIKRRLGIERGGMFFPMDQAGFIVFGLLLMWPFVDITISDFLVSVFLTIPLHMLVNRIGYWLGVKKVPW